MRNANPFPTVWNTAKKQELTQLFSEQGAFNASAGNTLLADIWGGEEAPEYSSLYQEAPSWWSQWGSTVTGGLLGLLGGPLAPITVPLGAGLGYGMEQRETQQKQHQTTELQRDMMVARWIESNGNWYLDLMEAYVLAGMPIQTADDFLAAFEPPAGIELNDAEKAWFQNALDATNAMTKEEIEAAQAARPVTEEEQAQMDELLTWLDDNKDVDYELQRVFRHLITYERDSAEVFNAFLRMYELGEIEGLPEGLTENELVSLMQSYTQGAAEEEVEVPAETELSLQEELAEISRLHNEQMHEMGRMETVPNPTLWTVIKQPFLLPLEALNLYVENVARPLAGHFLITIASLTGQTEDTLDILRLYNDAREQENFWQAAGTAFENSQVPTVLKFGLEIALDPLTYVGVGVLPKIFGRLGRPLSWIGKLDATIAEGMNLPFDGILAVMKKIPKLPAQSAKTFAQQSLTAIQTYVIRDTGKSMRHLTGQEIQASLRKAVREGGSSTASAEMQAAHKALVVNEGLKASKVASFSRKIDGIYSNAADISDEVLETLLDRISVAITRGDIAIDDAIEALLTKMGARNTVENMKLAREFVDDYIRATDGFVDNLITGTTSKAAGGANKEIGAKLYKKLFDEGRVFYGEAVETSFKEALRLGQVKLQRGRFASAFVWGVNRFNHSGFVKYTSPFVRYPARWFLGFSGYVFFNAAEVFQRSVFGGAVPKRATANQITRMTEGLNVPAFLVEDKGFAEEAMLMSQRELAAKATGEVLRTNWRTWAKDFMTGQYWVDMSNKLRVWQHGYWRQRFLENLAKTYDADPILGDLTRKTFNNIDALPVDRFVKARLKEHTVMNMKDLNPDGVRNLLNDVAEDVLKEKQILDILSKHGGELSSNVVILDALDSGTLLDDLLALKTECLHYEEMQIIHSPAMLTELFKETKEAIHAIPMNSYAEVLEATGKIKMLEMAYEGFPQVSIDEAYSLAARTKSNTMKAKIWDDAFKTVEEASEEGIKCIEEAKTLLKDKIDTMLGLKAPTGGYQLSSVTFSAPGYVSEAQVQRILDYLPPNISPLVKEIRVLSPSKMPKLGSYSHKGRVTISTAAIDNPDVWYHEFGHAILGDKIASGDTAFLADAADAVGLPAQAAKLRALTSIDAKTWMTTYKDVSEKFAKAFGQHCRGTLKNQGMKTFMSTNFPPNIAKKIKKPQVTKELAAAKSYLDTLSRRQMNWDFKLRAQIEYRKEFFAPLSKGGKGYTKSEMTSLDWDNFYQGLGDKMRQYRRHDYVLAYDEWLDTLTAGTMAFKLPKPRDFTKHQVLTRNDLARIIGAHPNDMVKSLIDNAFLQSEDGFTAMIMAYAKKSGHRGITEEKVRAAYNGLFSDITTKVPFANTAMQSKAHALDSIFGELEYLRRAPVMSKANRKAVEDMLEDTAKELEGIATPEMREAWMVKSQEAADAASKDYYRNFPAYGEETALDSFMRYFFPYWNYEWQRLPYLGRLFASKPVVPLTWSAYTEYTDRGYLRIPGTDLEVNPFRGTVFMGGFFNLFVDFPEFQDENPGFMDAFDLMQRWGFYPNALMMLPFATVMSRNYMQTGQMVPAPFKSIWALAANIPGLETYTQRFRQFAMPDRFVDYQLAQIASSTCQERRLPYSGVDIWNYVRDETIMPFEANPGIDNLLNSADANDQEKGRMLKEMLEIWEYSADKFAKWDFMIEQTGCMRLYDQDREEARNIYRSIITEITGLSEREQNALYRRGYRITDFMGRGYTPQERELIEGTEYRLYWSGLTTPLQPYSQQIYFRAAREMSLEYQLQRQRLAREKTELDMMLTNGEITIDEWGTRVDALESEEYTLWDNVRETNTDWAMLPKDFNERMVMYAELGIPQYVPSFQDQLLELYFDLEAPEVNDVNFAGEVYRRKDYSVLYFLQDRITELAEQWGIADEFQTAIQSQYSSPLDTLQKEITERYLRPYWDMQYLAKQQFSTREQRIIDEYRLMEYEDPAYRTQLREQLTDDGTRKIISSYESVIGGLREMYRTASPMVDYWLWFFGVTPTVKSAAAQRLIDQHGRDIRTWSDYSSYLTRYPTFASEYRDLGIDKS